LSLIKRFYKDRLTLFS